MKNFIVLALFVLIGCSHAKTSMEMTDPNLRPQTLKGPVEDIYEIAFRAAKRAFPEEDDIRKGDNWRIVIERDWFWRGDTIIEVLVHPISENECFITAESRVNWRRGNATMLDVSEDEIRYYISALREEYAEYMASKKEKR